MKFGVAIHNSVYALIIYDLIGAFLFGLKINGRDAFAFYFLTANFGSFFSCESNNMFVCNEYAKCQSRNPLRFILLFTLDGNS